MLKKFQQEQFGLEGKAVQAVTSTQLLRSVQQLKRYYARCFSGLLERTGLSMREMDVVLFLTNNPSFDTARDVTELRGLAKSQVSAAVEVLVKRGLLRRPADLLDRRVVRLAVTEAGAALGQQARAVQSACVESLFSGLTAAEAAQFQALLEKVLSGAQTQLEEGTDT